MTDIEVVESFDNAWRALCRRYREYPDAKTKLVLNMLGRIIETVEKEVKESHREKQMTLEDWIEILKEKDIDKRN